MITGKDLAKTKHTGQPGKMSVTMSKYSNNHHLISNSHKTEQVLLKYTIHAIQLLQSQPK